MKKKNIAILVAVIVIAVITVLILLFNLKTYSVMYNTNGGSFVATEKVKVFMKATKPNDPTRDGYTFDNWYYNDGIFDFDTRITQDMVIEARWIEGNPIAGTYVISFNSNGGSSVASVRSNEDGTVNQPNDPVREGYRFVSWQYNGEDFDFGSKVTSNMTLVAKWEEEGEAGESVPAEKVSVSPTAVSLRVGNTRRINVSLLPKEATNRPMKWTTSNSRVATVDNYGNVKAVGIGSATITVEVDGIKASVAVTVTQAATSIDQNPTNPSTPTTPTTPTVPDDPTPVVPDPPVTYSVVMVDELTSALAQTRVYIRSSLGQNVAGYATITYAGGAVKEEYIPAEGKLMVKTVIQNAVYSRLS